MPPSKKVITSVAVPTYTNDQIINAATGHWGEVAQEIKPAAPYVITRPDGDDIVISPLTRSRRKRLKTAQAAYLMVGAQLAEVQTDNDADQSTVTRIQKLMDEAEYEYDRAVFGDAVDEVYGFFDELQEEFWDAMYADVHAKLVNRVTPPEDVCSKCGQNIDHGDEAPSEEGGKGQSSSTSLTDTGQKSKETSTVT